MSNALIHLKVAISVIEKIDSVLNVWFVVFVTTN